MDVFTSVTAVAHTLSKIRLQSNTLPKIIVSILQCVACVSTKLSRQTTKLHFKKRERAKCAYFLAIFCAPLLIYNGFWVLRELEFIPAVSGWKTGIHWGQISSPSQSTYTDTLTEDWFRVPSPFKVHSFGLWLNQFQHSSMKSWIYHSLNIQSNKKYIGSPLLWFLKLNLLRK